ncbi:MAG: hypothetical protein F7C34_00360 [Desulfurococcales archaeon]|nr:hypothetical protein [Desulfurococcales archaeon]
MGRRSLTLDQLIHGICSNWRNGIGITSLADALGVSRPTLYRAVRTFRDEYGLVVRLIPNTRALGISIYIVRVKRGSAVSVEKMRGDYIYDFSNNALYRMIYVPSEYGEALEAFLREMGAKYYGPFTIAAVKCGSSLNFPARKRARPTPVEARLLSMLTASMLEFKEAAESLGITLQQAKAAVDRLIRKNLIVSPIAYQSPLKSGKVGVVKYFHGPLEDFAVGRREPAILLRGEGSDLSAVLTIDEIGNLFAAALRQSRVSGWTHLSPDLPLPPVPQEILLRTGREAAIREILLRLVR